MTKRSPDQALSRRRFFTMAGKATVAAAGMGALPVPFGKLLAPVGLSQALAQTANPAPDLFYAGTDGWISLPATPAIISPALGAVHPDPLAPTVADGAPPGLTTYIFGFRNVTGLTDLQRSDQKNKAQHSAPVFWLDQYDPDPASPRHKDFRMQLTNLGLALRPDLFDAHTIHWHGFRNVIPFFDGEPTGSVAVTTGRFFQYIYRPRDPGTYMFHCHVEDTEHVHMGMTGPVWVRPLQNFKGGTPFGGNAPVARLGGSTAVGAPLGYAYNCGNGSTAYDREFAMFCSEVWCDSHWADAHIQLPEWTDYRADFTLLNGRVYPDTLAPSGSVDPFNPVRDDAGDLIAPVGAPHLKYQPLSSLVACNAGDRVLLRFANLGFREAAMTLAGIRMKVVGKDATPMKGRDGTDTSYYASTVSFGAGESIDAIFTAPAHSGGSRPDVYILQDRAYERANNLAVSGSGFGGRRTEIRVYPAGTVPAQTLPNT
jgi:FtsP/CotA-like multicopper oxidase with cupredoxin domain